MESDTFESADQESFGKSEKVLFNQSSRLIFVKVFKRRECARFKPVADSHRETQFAN